MSARLQTLAFNPDDVLVAALWAKAESLYRAQMEILGRYYRWSAPPLAWEDLGLETRLAWWDQALLELRLPDYAIAGSP